MSTPPQTRAIGKLKFTIRVGLIVIGVLLFLWVLEKQDDRAERPLTATFRNYEGSEDGSEMVAVLWLTNSSDRTFGYVSANAMSSNGTVLVGRELSDRTGTGWTNWITRITGPGPITSYTLPPHSGTLVATPFPNDGGIRRVAVVCFEPHKQLPGILAELRRLWWKVRPPRSRSVKVWCETELSYRQQTYSESGKR